MSRPPRPQRADYPWTTAIPTRWMDNDVYGHVNNVEYYSYFDTVINRYLIDEGGLNPHADTVIGIAVETTVISIAARNMPRSRETTVRGRLVGRMGADG